MIKVLFVCHGNICRSTMAQFVFQDMINQANLTNKFHIDSAATSREEIGNPPHYNHQQAPSSRDSSPSPPGNSNDKTRLSEL